MLSSDIPPTHIREVIDISLHYELLKIEVLVEIFFSQNRIFSILVSDINPRNWFHDGLLLSINGRMESEVFLEMKNEEDLDEITRESKSLIVGWLSEQVVGVAYNVLDQVKGELLSVEITISE